MSYYHITQSRGNSNQLSYRTSSASSAAQASLSRSEHRQYVAYWPHQQPLSPQLQRPSTTLAWVNDYYGNDEGYDSDPVPEMRSHHRTTTDDHDRRVTFPTQPPEPEPRVQRPAQTFDRFLETPAKKRRSFWLRILCGSGESEEGAHVVSPRDVPQSRSVLSSQPSVAARRRARHAGEPEELYRTRTGYDAATGQTYYSSRKHGQQ